MVVIVCLIPAIYAQKEFRPYKPPDLHGLTHSAQRGTLVLLNDLLA